MERNTEERGIPHASRRSLCLLRRVSTLALILALTPTILCGTAWAEDAKDDDDSDVTTLPKIVVNASRAEMQDALSPGVVSVAYPDDVKGEHKSLPDLLEQIPGVYVRQRSGSGHYATASIRGSAPSQVNIYIDGVPFNLSDETAADLSTIPISDVERVEVYRGTTPARFSGAPVGGAINIVTKKPSGLHGTVSVGARSHVGRQGGASLTTPLADGALLISLNKDSSKGNFKYKNLVVSQLRQIVNHDGTTPATGNQYAGIGIERTRRNNSSKKDDMLIKWQNDHLFAKWAYTHMNRFMANPILQQTTYGDQLVDTENITQNPRRQQKQGQHDVVFGVKQNFDDLTLAINTSMLDKHKWYRNLDETSGSNLWRDYQTRRYGIAGDVTYQLGHDWAIDQMLELHVDTYRETMHASMSNQSKNKDFRPYFRRHKTDIQAQDTFTLNFLDGLQITPLGRLERMSGPSMGSLTSISGTPEGDYGWKPTGGISAKKFFGDGWQVFGSYGTYNRYPNFYELYGDGLYVLPRTDSLGQSIPLLREFGRNSDIGIGWDGHLAQDLSSGIRLTYFERKVDNEINLYTSSIRANYRNTGNTYHHGAEVEGYVAWGKRADLQFAATRQEGWYRDGGLIYYNGATSSTRWPGLNRTINTPTFNTNARLNLHFLKGDLTTFLEVKHVSRVYIDMPTYESALTTFDTGMHYTIGHGVKFSFGVKDLFNQAPKQSLKGTGGYSYSTTSGPPWASVTEYTQTPISYNVMNPHQGRTIYTTLAWSF
ncbi:MAG: TonB-dependent receptor plug domain-containing protein [Rhodospirillaceae bacterium]|nr:TonB-dependent receptor plug domain-containing protein [Rhodospirillaceae bacterium]